MNKTMLLFSEKKVLLFCLYPPLEKSIKTRHPLASPFIPQDAVDRVTSERTPQFSHVY